MWIYERKLQYPVKIKTPNAAMAKVIMTQLGGPNGELGASTRYLNQRYSMPYREVQGTLTDVGVSCSKCSGRSVFFLPEMCIRDRTISPVFDSILRFLLYGSGALLLFSLILFLFYQRRRFH